jgi:hypothetical protein
MGSSELGSRVRRLAWPEAAAYVVLGAGFVLMTLGMLEIGGLFAVGAGFVVVIAGSVLLFARSVEATTPEEETFARQLRDL